MSGTITAADIFVRVFGNGDKDVPGRVLPDIDVRKSSDFYFLKRSDTVCPFDFNFLSFQYRLLKLFSFSQRFEKDNFKVNFDL